MEDSTPQGSDGGPHTLRLGENREQRDHKARRSPPSIDPRCSGLRVARKEALVSASRRVGPASRRGHDRESLEASGVTKAVVEADFDIDDRDVAQDFFTRLISLYKNLNYSPDDSAEYARYLREVEDLVDSKRMKFAAAEEETNAW